MTGRRHTVETVRQQVQGRLALGMVDRTTRYGLRRDLRAPHQHPSAKIDIEVRRMTAQDADRLYGDDRTTAVDRQELRWRRRYVEKQLRHGWVAVEIASGQPCYVQWLLPASENPFVTQAGDFPPLAADEALLEHAYTPEDYRGMGIMSAAMSRIAEQAAPARFVMTYVGEDNVASLKGCRRAGFAPHLVHLRTRRVLGLSDSHEFVALDDHDPRRSGLTPPPQGV